MSTVTVGLILAVLAQVIFLAVCFAIAVLVPESFFGRPARAVLSWVPPFAGGDVLRDWAASTAERLAKERLAGKRTARTAARLAADVEEGAMHAMLPMAGPDEIERVIACPDAGQGMIGVTAPEALSIAAYLRKHCSRSEQQRIYGQAVENARKLAARSRIESAASLPCPLSGADHVCCVYAARPLRCRPLHAASIAKDVTPKELFATETPTAAWDEQGREQTVAQGVEMGLTRAMKAAGVDANVYELNYALATAMGTPDAAERWAKGENVFKSAAT